MFSIVNGFKNRVHISLHEAFEIHALQSILMQSIKATASFSRFICLLGKQFYFCWKHQQKGNVYSWTCQRREHWNSYACLAKDAVNLMFQRNCFIHSKAFCKANLLGAFSSFPHDTLVLFSWRWQGLNLGLQASVLPDEMQPSYSGIRYHKILADCNSWQSYCSHVFWPTCSESSKTYKFLDSYATEANELWLLLLMEHYVCSQI